MFIRIETTMSGKNIKFGVPSSQRDDSVLASIILTDEQIEALVKVFSDYEQVKQYFNNVGSAWQVELSE